MDYSKYEFGLRSAATWDSEKIGRFYAFFPAQDLSEAPISVTEIPKYIKLKINDKTHYLATETKPNKKGYIYISSAIYSEVQIESIAFKKSSELRFLLYKMIKDKNQKLALWGLLIAAIGLVIDGTFAIGKTGCVKWTWTEKEIVIWMVGAMILKILGLVLVYFKALRETR